MAKYKLGEICSVLNGYAFKSSKYTDSGIRVIRITNVQKGRIEDEDPKFYPLEYKEELEKYMLYENDILLSLTGNVGRVALLERKYLPSALNQRVACLRIKDEKKVNRKYLYMCLLSDKFEKACINSSKGIAQKNLSTEWLKSYEVEIPEIEEQNKIVKELDDCYQIIKNRRETKETLKQLIVSKFYELFGEPVMNEKKWATKKIGDIAFVTKLAGFEYTEYINYQEHGEVVVIKGLNVKEKKLKLDEISYIDKETSDKLPRSQLKENDIVMTYVGINIGDVALVDDKHYYHLAPNVAKISINDKNEVNPIFLVNQLYLSRVLFSNEATNTAKQALNMNKIRSIELIIPPVELQNQFAEYTAIVEKMIETVENEIAESEELLESKIDILL